MKKIIMASGVFVLALFFTVTLALADGKANNKGIVYSSTTSMEKIIPNTVTKKLVIPLKNIDLIGVIPDKCIFGNASYDQRVYSVSCRAGYTLLYVWDCNEGSDGREITISEKFTNDTSTAAYNYCSGTTSLTVLCCPIKP